jgi:DNA-binding NarL/FixJ family response regulator
MKVIVISDYDVLREGIVATLSKCNNIEVQLAGNTIKESDFMIRGKLTDILLFTIHVDNEDELDLISEINNICRYVKVIILDFNSNNKLFIKALKHGVKGYITGKSNDQELIYAINQVYMGKKYFDFSVVDRIVKHKS